MTVPKIDNDAIEAMQKDIDEIKQILKLLSINDISQPNLSPLYLYLQNLSSLQRNSKLLGREMAEKYYGEIGSKKVPRNFDPFTPSWQPTRFADYEQAWFIEICEEMQIAPILHRKVWELAYIVAILKAYDKLKDGVTGLGFGVGGEPFPSYFAAKGVKVLATDLDVDNQSAKGWIETNQHGSLEALFKSNLVSKEVFDNKVRFNYLNMNELPEELYEKFDFCWSTCAFEHLGSIELGLKFIEESCKLLKPGGISVHTTEFNFTSDDETLDNWPIVLFRKQDFERLANRLRQKGYIVPPISYDVGDTPVDKFIDIPPYTDATSAPSLKLTFAGFHTTCYGVVVQRPY